MVTSISFADISKFALEIPQKLIFPVAFLTNLFRNVMLNVIHSLTTIGNSLAILFCYLYLKNFRQHSLILVDGYMAIFKIFTEYIGATVCVCYGLLEMDLHYLVLGVAGITIGLCLKALLLYQKKLHQGSFTKFATRGVSGLYLFCIFLCCNAFHDVTMKVGALRCATRILTCVVPLVALSDNFRAGGDVFFSLCTDVLAVSALWWYCSHLSFKYFVVLPSVIGTLFTFIRYVLDEIQKAASKEVETDLYT